MSFGDKLMSWIFSIFYYATLFCMVWYILQFNWGELNSLEVLEKIGIIGGLYYFGDLFGKESKNFGTQKRNKEPSK